MSPSYDLEVQPYLIDMSEIWVPVRDYPNYEVSNHGRVKRLRDGKEMKQPPNGGGYASSTLTNSDGKKTWLIHRLVAAHFVPNPDHKPMVDHINGIRSDNRAENLRWCTATENHYNRRVDGKGTSRYKGVYRHTQTGAWIARIRENKTYEHLGSFKTEEEAARAYNQKAVQLAGEFANLNVV